MSDSESWGIDGAFDSPPPSASMWQQEIGYALGAMAGDPALTLEDACDRIESLVERVGSPDSDAAAETESKDASYEALQKVRSGNADRGPYVYDEMLGESGADEDSPYQAEAKKPPNSYASGGSVFDASSWYGLANRDFWKGFDPNLNAPYNYHLPPDTAEDVEPDYTPKQFWDIATEADQDVAEFMSALGKTENEDVWIKKPDFIQTWDVQKNRKGTAHYVRELDEFIEVRLYDDADGQTWVQWWND